MPVRALLVLLVMLNFGVATWWLLRPGPLPPRPWVQPEGVATLRLLGEAGPAGGAPAATAALASTDDGAVADSTGSEDGDGPGPDQAAPPGDRADTAAAPEGGAATGTTPPADPSPDATAADGTTAPAGAPALRCMSFGPYADASSVAAARSTLGPFGAAQTRVRDVVDAPRGWRVAMAPQPDRAAADALAAKIRDAGFDDLLVIPSGAEANGIALGRYGSEAAARRRESSLRAAGFPARAQPLGDVSTRHWLDLAAGPAFDAAAARSAAGAAEVRGIDCAGVVAVAAR
ncbi:MAG TPA: SPOR domain-containing protein [Luteimonas sp.]